MSNIYGFDSLPTNNNRANSGNSNLDVRSNNNEQSESLMPKFSFKSFYFTITIFNSLIFLFEIIIFKLNENYEWNCLLYDFGAKYSPAIKHDYHIHRLFLPIFIHGSLSHIVTNNISILFLGLLIENLLGLKKIITLYFLSGIYSQLLSTVTDIENISVGASGSIMGLSGFFLLFYLINYRNLADREKKFFYIFLVFTLINIFQTTSSKGEKIDIFSHIGGFVFGSLIGILLIGIEKIRNDDQIPLIKKCKIISIILLIISLGVFIGLIFLMDIGKNLLGFLCKK